MDKLTPSERRLLPYLMTGLDLKTIAPMIPIAYQTLRNQKLEIETKLGVRGTALEPGSEPEVTPLRRLYLPAVEK